MGTTEDYIETVLTCEGDFYDPEFHTQLEEFSQRLQHLISPDSEHLILKKVEPWNSVKITFNIPREAAVRLKQLAEQGDQTLRELGILSVQIEGDRSISLTIAGKNNETTELVFRTTGPIGATGPAAPNSAPAAALGAAVAAAVGGGTAAAFDMSSSDELALSGPSNVETTRKNIARYLGGHGNASNTLTDIFGSQAPDGEFKVPSSLGFPGQECMPPLHNSPSPSASRSPGYQPSLPSPQAIGHNIRPPPSYSSAAAAATAATPFQHQGLYTTSGQPQHHQGQLSPASPKYPTPPPSVSNPNSPGLRTSSTAINMSPVQAAALQQHAHHAGHHVNPIMNNMARLMGHKDITSSSPLLVNLLQNDANALGHFNSLAQHGKLQFPFDTGPPPKKKRKPRKPKEGKAGKGFTGATSSTVGQLDVASTIPPQDRVPVSGEPAPSAPGQFMRAQSTTPPSSATAGLLGHPVLNRSPDGKPRQIINPITGQLEVVEDDSSNSSVARSESTASGVSLDTGPTLSQLQPPPNPLVALQQSKLFPNHSSSAQTSTISSPHSTAAAAVTPSSQSMPARPGSQESNTIPRDQLPQPQQQHQQVNQAPHQQHPHAATTMPSGLLQQPPPPPSHHGMMGTVSSSTSSASPFNLQLTTASSSSAITTFSTSASLPQQQVSSVSSSSNISSSHPPSVSAAVMSVSASTSVANPVLGIHSATSLSSQPPAPQPPHLAHPLVHPGPVPPPHSEPNPVTAPPPHHMQRHPGLPPAVGAANSVGLRHGVPPPQPYPHHAAAGSMPPRHQPAAPTTVATSSSLSLLGQMVHSQFPAPVPSRPNMIPAGAACSAALSNLAQNAQQHQHHVPQQQQQVPPQVQQQVPPQPLQQQPVVHAPPVPPHSSSVPLPFQPQAASTAGCHQPPHSVLKTATATAATSGEEANHPLPPTDTPPSSTETQSNVSSSDNQSPSSHISPNNLLQRQQHQQQQPPQPSAPEPIDATVLPLQEHSNAEEKASFPLAATAGLQKQESTDSSIKATHEQSKVDTSKGPLQTLAPNVELPVVSSGIAVESTMGATPRVEVPTSGDSVMARQEEAMDMDTVPATSPSVSPTSTMSSSHNLSPVASSAFSGIGQKDSSVEPQDMDGKESPSKEGSDVGSKESPSYASSGNTNGPTSMDSADSGVSMGTNMSDKKDTPPNGGMESYELDSLAVDQAGPVLAETSVTQENNVEIGEGGNVDTTNIKPGPVSPIKMPLHNSVNHDSELSSHSNEEFECNTNDVTENHKGVESPGANSEMSQDTKTVPDIPKDNGPKPINKNVITVGYAMSNEQQPGNILSPDISDKVLGTALAKKSESEDVPFLVRPYCKLPNLETDKGLKGNYSSIDQSLNWMGRSDLNPGGQGGGGGKDMKALQLGKVPISPVNGDEPDTELKLWVGGKLHSQNNNKPDSSSVEIPRTHTAIVESSSQDPVPPEVVPVAQVEEEKEVEDVKESSPSVSTKEEHDAKQG